MVLVSLRADLKSWMFSIFGVRLAFLGPVSHAASYRGEVWMVKHMGRLILFTSGCVMEVGTPCCLSSSHT